MYELVENYIISHIFKNCSSREALLFETRRHLTFRNFLGKRFVSFLHKCSLKQSSLTRVPTIPRAVALTASYARLSSLLKKTRRHDEP